MKFTVHGYRKSSRKYPVVQDVDAANIADALAEARRLNAEIARMPIDRIDVLQGGQIVKHRKDDSGMARIRRSGAEDHL